MTVPQPAPVTSNGWYCLACDKRHPDNDPHVEIICESCETAGLGHPDEYRSECRDCFLDRMAQAPRDE